MDYLKQFALEDHGGKYPAQLSGGMRQRVAIAQQFMCSEHFLLMDEPFSGLDVNAIDRVCRFIQEVAASDELKSIIVVTHDISAAVQVCDTIWLLGRDREPDGTAIHGARGQKSVNLIERDLAWHETVIHMPRFSQTVQEIRDDFSRL